MTNVVKRLISHLPYELIVILVIVGFAAAGVTVASNKISKNLTANVGQKSPSPSPIETPSPSPTPTPSTKPISQSGAVPAVTYNQPPATPTLVPTQNTKIDSATRIELCKTEAETFKTQAETALVLVYAQNNPEIVELEKASTIYETEQVAIKYGRINEGDLDANFTVVSNYLTNLHDWAVKQVVDYMGVVEAKGKAAYNDRYTQCLNQ